MTPPTIARPLKLEYFAEQGFEQREEFIAFSEYDVVLDDESMESFDPYIEGLYSSLGKRSGVGEPLLKRQKTSRSSVRFL